ncbi:hypothetical protein T439DRAFT_383253 [Meredithblackwellia eburnea MCA 4105]
MSLPASRSRSGSLSKSALPSRGQSDRFHSNEYHDDDSTSDSSELSDPSDYADESVPERFRSGQVRAESGVNEWLMENKPTGKSPKGVRRSKYLDTHNKAKNHAESIGQTNGYLYYDQDEDSTEGARRLRGKSSLSAGWYDYRNIQDKASKESKSKRDRQKATDLERALLYSGSLGQAQLDFLMEKDPSYFVNILRPDRIPALVRRLNKLAKKNNGLNFPEEGLGLSKAISTGGELHNLLKVLRDYRQDFKNFKAEQKNSSTEASAPQSHQYSPHQVGDESNEGVDAAKILHNLHLTGLTHGPNSANTSSMVNDHHSGSLPRQKITIETPEEAAKALMHISQSAFIQNRHTAGPHDNNANSLSKYFPRRRQRKCAAVTLKRYYH